MDPLFRRAGIVHWRLGYRRHKPGHKGLVAVSLAPVKAGLKESLHVQVPGHFIAMLDSANLGLHDRRGFQPSQSMSRVARQVFAWRGRISRQV